MKKARKENKWSKYFDEKPNRRGGGFFRSAAVLNIPFAVNCAAES